LNETEGWKPSISVKQILVGCQELLNNPNENSPAQEDAFYLYINNREQYYNRVREQKTKYPL